MRAKGSWSKRLEMVGFDYRAALLKMRKERTYEQLAELCGYAGKSGIERVIQGSEPLHRNGELIHGAYRDLFGEKPPLRPGQGIEDGAQKVHPSGRKRRR